MHRFYYDHLANETKGGKGTRTTFIFRTYCARAGSIFLCLRFRGKIVQFCREAFDLSLDSRVDYIVYMFVSLVPAFVLRLLKCLQEKNEVTSVNFLLVTERFPY